MGPKNSENRSTRIPTAFAAVKWPASCRMISAAKPRNASAYDIGPSVWQLKAKSRLRDRLCVCAGVHKLARELPRLAVRVRECVERVHRPCRQPGQRLLDDLGDL